MEGGEGAEGPNRMSESWTYSAGTRPILQYDSNRALLSGDYYPSEIATDRMGKHNYNGTCLGATDLDTETDKVNPPKNNNYVSQLSLSD
jgi:hypothetical protein